VVVILVFQKKLKSSSIFVHFCLGRLSSRVKIRLHAKNQPPGGVVGVASYQLSSEAPTHVEVELGCDTLSVEGGDPGLVLDMGAGQSIYNNIAASKCSSHIYLADLLEGS
jgi:hypothetical protein